MTLYTIEFQDRHTGKIESQPLDPGTTEDDAVFEVGQAAIDAQGTGVYLAFFREEDQQHGYINPSGAGVVAEDWV